MSAVDLPVAARCMAEMLSLVNTAAKPVAETRKPSLKEKTPVPGFLRADDRELLRRLHSQVQEYGGQLDRVCKAVGLRGIDGFTDAEMRAIGVACAIVAAKVDLRLTQDHAARMQAQYITKNKNQLAA